MTITYVEYHIGTSVATPELWEVSEQLAARYELGISEYFGELYKTPLGVPVP